MLSTIKCVSLLKVVTQFNKGVDFMMAVLSFSYKANKLLYTLQNKGSKNKKKLGKILAKLKRSPLKKLSNEILDYIINFLLHDEKLLESFLEYLDRIVRKHRKLLLHRLEAFMDEEEEQELLKKINIAKIRSFYKRAV